MKPLKTFIYEQLIGKKGTTTNLEKAIELERNGASELEILKQTNWQRGHDNNWKFEIPNGSLKVTEIDDIKTRKPSKEDAISLASHRNWTFVN